MAYPLAGETQTGMNIFKLKVRVLIKNLLGSHPVGEELQHVTDANSHSPDTWSSTALLRVYCDSIKKMCHTCTLSLGIYHNPSDNSRA